MYEIFYAVCFVLQSALLNGVVAANKDFLTTETIETHSACFGTHTQFQASCANTPGSVIGIKDIKVGAKPLASGCPEEIRDNLGKLFYLDFVMPFTNTSCCQPNYTSDCLFSYESTEYNYFKYYNICTGLQNCTTVLPVSRSPTSCSHADYLNYTNYMLVEFACIQETRIFAIDSTVSTSTTGQALYLKTPSYPNISPGGTAGECSLHTDSPGSTINMFTLDRRMNDVSGCLQSLTVSDGEQTLASWDSSLDPLFHVNKFAISGNYARVNFTQAAGVDCGVFFIGFEASDSSTSLSLTCPAGDPPVDDANTGQSTSGGGDSSTFTIIVVVLLLLLLIALLVALCLCFHKHWCCFRKNKVEPEDDNEKKAEDGLDMFYLQREATVSTAPANTAFHGPLPLNPNILLLNNGHGVEAKPARLPPLSADNEDPTSTKKKKKKKTKRLKFKNQDVEGDDVFLIEANGGVNNGETDGTGNEEKKKKKKKKKKRARKRN